MTEDQVVSKILRDAEAVAEATLRKAEKAAEDLIRQQREQALKDAERAATPFLARANEEAEAARRQVLTEARSRANWNLLNEKRRLIEEALASAVKMLVQNLRGDPSSYVKLLSHLAREGGVALGGGDLELVLNPQDVRLPLNLNAIAAQVEKETGAKTVIHVSRRRMKNVGGVLIQAEEGRRTVDNSFEGIVERRRRELEAKASQLLFAT
ncbi:MAG: V-type ATP synthase subunit E family protein [Candidatus Bathyarchaeia archaeon]